jgi:hypothetical protein
VTLRRIGILSIAALAVGAVAFLTAALAATVAVELAREQAGLVDDDPLCWPDPIPIHGCTWAAR